jgi:hypothetical protein
MAGPNGSTRGIGERPPALQMIEEGERSGALTRGKVILLAGPL